MNLLTLGWVAIGGAIGSVSRFVLSTAILRLSGSLFPVGTFAVMGFGAHSRIHTAKLLELSQDLPIVIEIVDAPEKIEAFMPDLEAMVGDGLITLERAEVLLYRPGRT